MASVKTVGGLALASMKTWGGLAAASVKTIGGVDSGSGTSYSSTVLADSPIGYWQLEETSGTTYADSSGNAISGTYVNSPTLNQAGPVTGGGGGGAPQFAAGSSQYGQSAYKTSAPNYNTSSGSAEAWFKTSTSGVQHEIFRIDDGNTGANRRFLIEVTSANKLKGQIIIGTNPSVTSAASVNDGAWHHAVLTWNFTGGNTVIELYLDGTSLGTATATGVSMGTTASSVFVQIGDYYYQGGSPLHQNFWTGYIGQVALYTTALSSTRVTAHWNAR